MENKKFEELCIRTVVDYFNSHVEKTDNKKITESDVYVVWMCKTLQNNKALVSTTVSDGLYYEITHNGDKNETYVDVYKKWENFVAEEREKNFSYEENISKENRNEAMPNPDKSTPRSITITESEFRELCLSKLTKITKTDEIPPAIGMLVAVVLARVAHKIFREKEEKENGIS